MYHAFGKRLLDLSLAIPALILLSPVLVLIALLVHVKLGAPILFCQSRPGKNGRLFKIFKFRTMLDLRDKDGKLLSNEQRVTPFGCFLRSTSLDELPELWNVVRGEMSLVGPRPLLIRYLDRYTPQQARRHQVLPGMTGWAQVNGRNGVAWNERLDMDVWYVDNLSFCLDIKIMIMTLVKVLLREGTDATGNVPDFWGTLGPPMGGREGYPADEDETYLLKCS